jgi:ATP-dependent Lhr-like helicase
MGDAASVTEWSAATAQQLLVRYGVLTREVASAEAIPGGFSSVYPALRALEDAGRIRRGYFVAGVGATQFALPPALDMLRSLREPPGEPEVVTISAVDPANPYGTILRWDRTAAFPPPEDDEAAAGQPRGPSRSVGALVVLVNGACAAYVSRAGSQVLVFLPEDEPARSTTLRALALELSVLAAGKPPGGPLLIQRINGSDAMAHPLAAALQETGFAATAMGLQYRHPDRQ